MEIAALTDILKNTGPLGIGWVVAALLFWRMTKLQDQLVSALNGNTEALTMLRARIEGGAR